MPVTVGTMRRPRRPNGAAADGHWPRPTGTGDDDTVRWSRRLRRPRDGESVVDPVRPRRRRRARVGVPARRVPTGRRVRARLARFNAPWQSPQVSEVLEPLIAAHRVAHPKADIRLLQRAFDIADHWHTGQYRKSGDPYITHPLAVADDPRQPRHGHHHAGRRAAARHDRGHRLHAGDDARRLRRRGHAARRRRHQARQGQARRRGEGGDDPQDGRRDGQGPAGPGDQARRPAAQHAHADLPAARRSRSRRRRRRWRSWRRWRTGSA